MPSAGKNNLRGLINAARKLISQAQKKAPPEPGLDKPPQSRGDKCAESIGNTLFHSCPISSHTWLTSFSTGTIASHWRTTSFMFPVFNTLVKACAVMNMRALLSI